jgi:hypothetical protein
MDIGLLDDRKWNEAIMKWSDNQQIEPSDWIMMVLILAAIIAVRLWA